MPKKKVKRKTARPKPYRASWRFGILNHYGEIWSPETFNTEAQAQQYLDAQKRDALVSKLSGHRVVPVRVTVSVRT